MANKWSGVIVFVETGDRFSVGVLKRSGVTPDSRFLIFSATGPTTPVGFQEMEIDDPLAWLAGLTARGFRFTPLSNLTGADVQKTPLPRPHARGGM
jgi:hypothetical protein